MPAAKRTAAKSKAHQPSNVKVGPPHVPPMYRAKRKGDLPWSHAEQRLIASRSYWVCTTRPDGRPHSIPVWGFWHQGAFYFGTHRETRKAKNLAANPNISVHLESGDDVVILEGRAEEVDTKQLVKDMDAVCRKKYGMPMMVVDGGVSFRVRPRIVLAWLEKEFPYTATRWEFKQS
jgi:hypothetical protein